MALLLGATGCGGPDDTTAAPVPSTSVKAYGSVVEAADAFLATLDDAEKKQVQLEFTQDKATAWSNLPCGATCRPGIELGDLDAGQIGAAKSVLKTALGTGTASGFARVEQIFLADDYLGALQASGGGGGPGGGMPSGGLSGGGPGGGMPSGGGPGGMPGGADSGYSSGTYFLAFLGKPSADGTWQLHFGGHHLAINLTYKAGKVAGVSPFFVGVEPTSWTASGSQSYAPLDDLRDAMLAMTSSLSEAEQAKAKLPQTYTDVLAGPGKDGQFPATKQGLAVSSLDRDQQKLVLAAIKPWVANADDATTAGLLKTYESQLDGTFISWSGTLALTTHADYVRIDGPSVWVEFVCQNGIVIQDKIHYHTVYRDHTRDYGGEFTFS